MAKRLWIDFLLEFVPACLIALAGLRLGFDRSGFWSASGWTIAVAFCIYALLQVAILINGLYRIHHRGHVAALKL